MQAYGSAHHVAGQGHVPLPTQNQPITPRERLVVCPCGHRGRPGTFHICIDLGTPEPVVVEEPKRTPAKRRPKKAPPKKKGPGSGFGGGVGNNGGKVVARIEEVIRRYEDGETTAAIAADIGVTRKAIVYALKTRGVPIRPATHDQIGKPRLTMRALADEQITKLVEAYQAGGTATDLSKDFGVSVSTVIATLRREGVAIRAAGQERAFTPAEDVELGRLYSAGASLADLAAQFRVGTGPISRAIKRAGVPLRKPGIPRRPKPEAAA